MTEALSSIEEFPLVVYDDATTLKKGEVVIIHLTGVTGTLPFTASGTNRSLEKYAGRKIKKVLFAEVVGATHRAVSGMKGTPAAPNILIYSVGSSPAEVTSGANIAVDVVAIV